MKRNITRYTFYCLVIALCMPLFSSAQIITTIAGNGGFGYMGGGFSGDGGPATAAHLYAPSGIVTDPFHNIYFIDGGNWRIRKINSDNGTISTVIGNGTGGYSGDGGPATAAQISESINVDLDRFGNIYFPNGYPTSSIRKVDTFGIITTYAGAAIWRYSGDGGPATAALFNSLYDLKVDQIGNMYIPDYGNNRIRKIDTSGIINTIAGTGIAGVAGDGGPASVALIDSPLGRLSK